jgi:EmrB/QacA subfamily drug resistance transporter
MTDGSDVLRGVVDRPGPALVNSTSPATTVAGPARGRWAALAAICLAVLLVGIDNTIVNVALPTIGRELSAGISDLQWVVDGYTLVFATALLVGGHLGDRFGRRRILLVGLVAFAATSVATAFATTTVTLVAGRAAMGGAAALIYPATLALLLATFPERRQRATAIGIWSGVSGISVALGPIGGGLLVEHFGWASVFWVNVPLAAAAVLAVRALLSESRDPSPARFDTLGALLSVAGVGLLVWTLIEAPGHGWGSAATVGGLLGALALLAGFAGWERHSAHPLFDVRLFANARFSAASAAIAAAFFGLFGFIFLITQYFQHVRGYGVLEAGVATLPFAAVIGALAPVSIAAMKRWGTTVVVTTGLVVMSAGFVVAAGSDADSQYWGRVVTAMVLMAAGLALTSGPATEAISGALPANRVGAGSAVNDTTREVGGTLGVAVLGAVMSSVYGSRVVEALGDLGVPANGLAAARGSVPAGYALAEGLPAAQQAGAAAATTEAFLSGLSAASLVAAGATLLAAVGVAVFLPPRHRVAPARSGAAT